MIAWTPLARWAIWPRYCAPKASQSRRKPPPARAWPYAESGSATSHSDVAVSQAGLAAALFDQGKWADAETLQSQELSIWRTLAAKQPVQPAALNGLADALARLTRSLLAEGRFADAEPLARECQEHSDKQSPDDWSSFHARSLLGASLLGQQKFAEAEPLLLTGYEGLRSRAEKVPPEDKPRLKEALQAGCPVVPKPQENPPKRPIGNGGSKVSNEREDKTNEDPKKPCNTCQRILEKEKNETCKWQLQIVAWLDQPGRRMDQAAERKSVVQQ